MLQKRGSYAPVFSKDGARAFYTLKFQKVSDRPEMMYQSLHEAFQYSL